MRFSLSVLGGCVVSSMENGRRGKKKERKHCAIWKGREDSCGSTKSLWDSSFGFSSTCYGRFRIFLLFLTHWIYICISTFTSKFVWTSWGGNFGKSLEVNFSPWNANWIVTFSNWLFPRPIWFFFFLANFDHFKNIFFFFFPWSLTELSRIDRCNNDRENEERERGFLFFLRFVIYSSINNQREEGEGAAPLPFLLNNFNIRVNTRRDISSGNTLIASREVGRIG